VPRSSAQPSKTPGIPGASSQRSPKTARKTSVYLPDHLKRALTARAAATGRSEADVLRAAVAAEVAPATSTAPIASSGGPDPPQAGRLVGVGVGPGDADLLTLRGIRALQRADRIVAPATAPDAVGRAEAIVREALPEVRVERAPFAMHPDPQVRADAMEQVASTVAGYLDAGEEVAFITLGDPLTYSTFSGLADAVRTRRPDTAVEVVPGIMAFQSLAARTQTTLVDDRQRLSVRTALDGDDLDEGGPVAGSEPPGNPESAPLAEGSPRLADELRDPACTVVLYKGGRQLPKLAAAARAAGRSRGAVVGELLGMSGERIGSLDEMAIGPASYLATVILPASTEEQ
jgi:precorrin-2/cobalt-factor-2 C20-methyltransferase